MTKEELAKKKGLTRKPKPKQNPSVTLLTETVAEKESVEDIKRLEKPNGVDKNKSPHGSNRGRKKGKIFVPENKLKKTISISVSPEDEELYKDVIARNPKRFKGMSQLVEQALDFFIKENKLI